MRQAIFVAGGTGDLGGRIVRDLIKRRAVVRAIVRPGTDPEKVRRLESLGATVVSADLSDRDSLIAACRDVACVISALSGLRDVIVDAQTNLLEAAVAANVPRFIPSDFALDFTPLPVGDNRNFDLRREFHKVLDSTPISATSIMNGAFAEVLTYGTPLYDFRKYSVGYWGDDPDWRLDFTTMDNTADYTAAAALDDITPRVLRVAGFQVSPNELAAIGERINGTKFKLVSMGGLAEFAALNREQRAANPEGEEEVFPRWQQQQYMHSMFSTYHANLDNARYPDVEWTGAEEFLAGL